jgi:hypothetical protein
MSSPDWDETSELDERAWNAARTLRGLSYLFVGVGVLALVAIAYVIYESVNNSSGGPETGPLIIWGFALFASTVLSAAFPSAATRNASIGWSLLGHSLFRRMLCLPVT